MKVSTVDGRSQAMGRRMQGPVEQGQGMQHQRRIQGVSRGSTRVSRRSREKDS
jgi:hypothetical protein